MANLICLGQRAARAALAGPRTGKYEDPVGAGSRCSEFRCLVCHIPRWSRASKDCACVQLEPTVSSHISPIKLLNDHAPALGSGRAAPPRVTSSHLASPPQPSECWTIPQKSKSHEPAHAVASNRSSQTGCCTAVLQPPACSKSLLHGPQPESVTAASAGLAHRRCRRFQQPLSPVLGSRRSRQSG